MNTADVNYFGANPHVNASWEDDADEKTVRELSYELPESFTADNLVRGAWVEVDLKAIAHNLQIARKHIGMQRHLMAVVKANAYGHGAVPVAKCALDNGADYLAVATVEEGVELRRANITAPILVLSQPPMSAIPALLAYDLMPTVSTTEFALALGEEADLHGTAARYHLGVNTGMNRIGVFYLDVVDFLESINFHRGLALDGVFTHFATADEPSSLDFKMQLQRFNETLQMMRNACIDPGIVHCANSATIERYPEAYFDMVRVGITMYGLAPSANLREYEDLVPVMAVKARISHIKQPQLGEGVSYGFNYRVAGLVHIATLPLGYADGVSRALSGRMKVLCNGKPYSQVGNICMDQMMFEIPMSYSVNGREDAQIGDEVVIIGKQGDYEITLDMMADELGTINYELACDFGLRLPHIYV